jgi:putative endonuclease
MPMSNKRQALGRWGEAEAAAYLEGRGYIILDRNIHSAHGEIDIVAQKDQVVIFVEVKTLRSHSFAFPEAAVNQRKQTHMVSAAEKYLELHPEASDTWQFDVIAIEGEPGGEPQIEHFENVIS